MSKEEFTNSDDIEYLYEPHLLNLWSLSGSEWSSIFQEEIQASIQQPIAHNKHNRDKLVSSVILLILALLSTAMWVQSPKISRAVSEVAETSVKQVISHNY